MTTSLVLVIGPLDNREAVAKVASALRKQPGLVVVDDSELAEGVTSRSQWSGRWKEALAGRLPEESLESSLVSVVVVPRPDGTIGSGIRSDIHQAQEAKIPIKVSRPDGELVPLEGAGLALVSRKPHQKAKGKPGGKAAQVEFRKVAGRFFQPAPE